MNGLLIVFVASAAGGGIALAEPLDPGVLVLAGVDMPSDDPRLGHLAAGFARAGLESFVAHDMARPPLDAERPIIRGRWRANDARRLRRRGRPMEAAAAADQAIALFERHASEPVHLRFLVDAYVERGASALALQDPITAETVFLRAVALAPDHRPDKAAFGRPARRLYRDVRRAARLLRYGSVRIAAGLSSARVTVDFGPVREPPYETKLPVGRHFVTVSAPGRPDVVALVPVRAERVVTLAIRPPTAGDPNRRGDALAGYDEARQAGRRAALAGASPPRGSPSNASAAPDPTPRDRRTEEAIVELAAAAGLRFVAVVTAGRGVVRMALLDGTDGRPLPNGATTLSGTPAPGEVDAAVADLLQAGLTVAPELIADPDARPSWYETWWGITLIGVAVAAAATTATVLVLDDRETEYRFVP